MTQSRFKSPSDSTKTNPKRFVFFLATDQTQEKRIYQWRKQWRRCVDQKGKKQGPISHQDERTNPHISAQNHQMTNEEDEPLKYLKWRGGKKNKTFSIFPRQQKTKTDQIKTGIDLIFFFETQGSSEKTGVISIGFHIRYTSSLKTDR